MSVPGGLDELRIPLGLHLFGLELDEQGAGLALEELASFTSKPQRRR